MLTFLWRSTILPDVDFPLGKFISKSLATTRNKMLESFKEVKLRPSIPLWRSTSYLTLDEKLFYFLEI